MHHPVTRYFLFFICLFPSLVKAQTIPAAIPDSARSVIEATPVEKRDSIYRRWGNHFYALYTEDGMNKALECYLAALKIAREYHHHETVRLSYFDVGSVYDAMNNYRKASAYYELFYNEQLNLNDPKRVFRSAYNLATVASKASDIPVARKYTTVLVHQISRIRDDKEFLDRGHLMIANLMSRNHDTAGFIHYYSLLPEHAVFKDDELAYGRLYAEAKSNYQYMKGMGAASLDPLLNELRITRDSVPILTLIVSRLEALGNYKDAYSYKKQLDETAARQTSDQIRSDIERRLLGADNELIERKNQLLVLQQKHLLDQRRQLYGITAILMIGFLVATYSFFRIKTQNKQIGRQNAQIKTQHANIEVLLREVHHRVKNNLQIISSLIELQQLKPDLDPTESIKQVQIKLQSIALAHELMYRQHHIEQVPLQEYFEQMLQAIQRIYTIPAQRLFCEIEMNGLELNLDKLLLLALAIDELVINTLKHAFPYTPDCTISLSCRQELNQYIFTYSDNGPGIPANAQTNPGNITGTRLVKNLIKQVGGSMEIRNDNKKLEYIFTLTP